ncbi:LamG-like jellyroll fold domain-containing protein [Amycolatopsis sp. CA-161197]|uniref:LamG-like jellyroll fold domain-containing protein n=1 Tax=Amycolatopsis sp. CA-161197 TaxID=3239922 RepID=UPI003D94F352
MPKTPPQPGNIPTLEDGYGATQDQQKAMATASAQAKSSGKAVVVTGLTDETTQVEASPTGGFALTTNAQPVRTLQGGTWKPIDTTLHRNHDGTYSPAVTAYGTVALSGGGHGPLATTSSKYVRYTMSWPGSLPAPQVSGSTATYHEVLPGVDLAVSAGRTGGFSEVLVVKTAAAAKNPSLATLALPSTATGGSVHAGNLGGLTVSGGAGGPVLDAPTPFMWDSNTAVTAATGGGKVAADPSDTTHPGLAARQAVVATKVTPSTLSLVPDAHLLTAPATVFPVYIDPSFNWHPASGGTPAFDEVKQGQPCPNTSFYNRTGPDGDNGLLGVGYNNWDSCIGIQRTYYQWQLPSVIWGAHIGNTSGQPAATVNVSKLYSAACGVSSTDYLHLTGGIGSGTSWNNQPSPGPVIGSATLRPAAGNNCVNNSAVPFGFNVSSQIATAAANHSSQFTVSLTGNETRGSLEFSRFSDNPSLQIFYNLIPNTPGPLTAAAGSDNLSCATAAPYPYLGKTIAQNTPVLKATVTDPNADHLQATFKYWVDGTTTTHTGTSADNIASGTTANYSLPSSFTSSLTNGQVVDWQAQSTDGQDTSPWSPICHFIAEPTAPSEPSISSADGAFPDDLTVGKPANSPGQFTEASTGGTVSKLVRALDQAPPTTNPPAADVPPFTGGGVIAPAGRWTLTDGSGTTAKDTGGTNAMTLSGGASWTTDPSRGTVLTFDGSTGGATTTSPVVKSDGSFTMAAWVDLTSTSGYQTFLTQEGSAVGGFYLEYESDVNQWVFARFATDSPATGIRARASVTPVLNTWTHLAGTFDAATGTMTIYVNGVAAGTAVDSTPWNATGPLTIGHGFYNSAANNYLHGSISDVQLYQAALGSQELNQVVRTGGLVQPAGRWRMLDGTGGTAADTTSGAHAATLNGGYTWASTPTPAVKFNGTNGYAATAQSVVDTSHSFTASVWVNLTTLSGGYQTFLTQQGSSVGSFYLEYESDVNKWAFVRFNADTPGAVSRIWGSVTPAAGTWTHLVGTYDATSGTMTLYVNGTAAGTATDTTPWNGTGPLVIGRGFYGGAANNYTNGSVTDVQIYPSVLSASEVKQVNASSTGAITPLAPGPHTLYSYAADPAGDVSGYQSYRFVAAGDPNTTCISLAACYNNTGISLDTNRGVGNLDGSGNSLSAGDLTTAGWNSGGHLTANGATFTLPQSGSGQADNLLAANQTIAATDPALTAYNQNTPSTGNSALTFLTTATSAMTASPGAINGDNTAPYVPAGIAVAGTYCFDSTNPAAFCAPSGTITYSDGTSQTYYLTVPDWAAGPEAIDTVTLPHENQAGSQVAKNVKLYSFSVPLASGKAIASVTMPDVSNNLLPTTTGLHIFAMATRNTTVTGAPQGKTWTGAWANATEGQYNFEGGTNYANQTFRVAVKPSIAGNTVRIKLDDGLGTSPLKIGPVTIALTPGTSTPSASPSGPFTHVTFGGISPASSAPLTIPEGGMLYSDPLPFTVDPSQYLLVSFQLVNSVPYLVQHSWTNTAYEYVSSVGSGDHTTDTSGAAFAGTGTHQGWFTDVLTGVDVATTGTPTQAVLGDGLIDAWQPNTHPDGTIGFPDDLTTAEPTTPSGYGTIAEGIEANQLMTDNPQTYKSGAVGGPAALSRIDRDILDQPGINTVVVYEGLEDVLSGRTADDLTSNGYTQLIDYFKAYNINVIVAGLTPCAGYTGDGATPNNPCTTTVDQQRTTTNTWLSSGPDLLSQWTTPSLFYLDSDAAVGVPDTTTGETKLNSNADVGDHVNLSNAGYAALATAYLGPQDTWTLDDGDTTAADSGDNATNPYLITNPAAGANPATLTAGTSYTSDATRGSVLTTDGTTGYAATSGPVLATNGSYSISAWAKLDSTTQLAAIAAQDGDQNSAFLLGYDPATGTWCYTLSDSDTANAPGTEARSTGPAATGVWTHLVGTYNATTHTMSLYVNGTLAQTVTGVTGWNATGPFTIGRGKYTGTSTFYFPGSISHLQAWNYTLTPTQVTALAQQIN